MSGLVLASVVSAGFGTPLGSGSPTGTLSCFGAKGLGGGAHLCHNFATHLSRVDNVTKTCALLNQGICAVEVGSFTSVDGQGADFRSWPPNLPVSPTYLGMIWGGRCKTTLLEDFARGTRREASGASYEAPRREYDRWPIASLLEALRSWGPGDGQLERSGRDSRASMTDSRARDCVKRANPKTIRRSIRPLYRSPWTWLAR